MKRQLSSVSTEHGHYSEIYVHGPMGSGVGRLILDPFSMLLYSTRAEDFQSIKELTDQGMSVVEAIDTILKQRSMH
jgi:conjugal transfer ATP-binding protein TraC